MPYDIDDQGRPLIDFPEQHIPGQIDALDALDEEEAEDAGQP